MKFLQKTIQCLFSLTGEKQQRSIACSLWPCHAFPAVHYCSTFSCFQVCESKSTNRYTHSHFFCVSIFCAHTHTPTHTSALSNILKICTPVGLARCSEAQSKLSAHFLMQQRPWDFFCIYTLDNSGLFLHVAGGLCISQILVKHTSLCDYLECGASWARVLSFLKTD